MIEAIIRNALKEDIGPGDHSTLSCVPENATGKAKLLVKEPGIIAGVELAERICEIVNPELKLEIHIRDGERVQPGDIVFNLEGPSRDILSTERVLLNFMQRMSGIATATNKLVKLLEGTKTQVLDTRKTTPGIRYMEKWAVRIGGGGNHRFALYDMVMLKDNHIDYAGGVEPAILRANDYLKQNNLNLKIEVEVRNEKELDEVLNVGQVHRIMLDNFSPERIVEALKRIPDHYEVEASGGITLDTIRSYAETGVDFISVGAITHSVSGLDLSLKATFNKA